MTGRVDVRVRPPAVAGLFYPDHPDELRTTLARLLGRACSHTHAPDGLAAPKAIIAPHAGYTYSGPIAASAYERVATLDRVVERVLLLGPAHRVLLDGAAVPSVEAFATPLGLVEIDRQARDIALDCPAIHVDDIAHSAEHSLEVHLPFLQHVLGAGVRVLPIVVGTDSAATVGAAIDALWGGPETLIVVSTDLSHYEPYDIAQRHDRRTADAIVAGAFNEIRPEDACGAYPVRGLLAAAQRRELDAELLDLRNSGDTAGTHDRVVGYGAFALTPRPTETA
jgi:MEMO1 family protein